MTLLFELKKHLKNNSKCRLFIFLSIYIYNNCIGVYIVCACFVSVYRIININLTTKCKQVNKDSNSQ